MTSSSNKNSTLNAVGMSQGGWEAEVLREGARLAVMELESVLEHEVQGGITLVLQR